MRSSVPTKSQSYTATVSMDSMGKVASMSKDLGQGKADEEKENELEHLAAAQDQGQVESASVCCRCLICFCHYNVFNICIVAVSLHELFWIQRP